MQQTSVARSLDLIRPVVLVVDDEPAVLEALRALLAPRLEPAYRVETAASAEDALALVADLNPAIAKGDASPKPGVASGSFGATSALSHFPVALVISDEKMPGKAGTDLLIALRQAPAHRHGGRMIITGYAGLPSAKKAINEAEVDRYYPKPWDAEGALLPAVRQILVRFARKTGLDEYHLAAGGDFAGRRAEILAVRQAWWEYVNLMGLPAEEMGVELPSFEEAADSSSAHVIVERGSPRERAAVASIRLQHTPGSDNARIDALAFLPEEANETVETLLVRTAVLEASYRGATRLTTDAPFLRRDVYERLGFRPDAAAAEGTGLITMSVTLNVGAIDDRFATHAKRFASERRLCSCLQRECTSHEYAAERRGYFCPLDQAEGRVPEGFLGIDSVTAG